MSSKAGPHWMAGAAVTLVMLVGCGGDDSSSSETELRPADEVRAEGAAGEAASIGETVSLGGVDVTITTVEADYDEVRDGQNIGLVKVSVRSENRTEKELWNPEITIFCANNPEGGGWQADSTWPMYDALPAGTFDEGLLYLVLPGDRRINFVEGTESVSRCETPAVIRVSELGLVSFDNEEPQSFDYPIPESVVSFFEFDG